MNKIQQRTTVLILPSPEDLSKYKELDANFPERILSAFEAQGNHRRNLESLELKYSHIQIILGQVFAFSILLILVGFSIFCISKGFTGIAIGSIITAISGIVIAAYINKSQ